MATVQIGIATGGECRWCSYCPFSGVFRCCTTHAWNWNFCFDRFSQRHLGM